MAIKGVPMSWNDTFYWLAILTLALALAQFGISYVSASTYTGIFKREPSKRVREVIRVIPKFLAIISLLALVLALFAGFELITGFVTNLAILLASHLNLLGNAILLSIIAITMWLVLTALVLFFLVFLWRFAAETARQATRYATK